MRLLLALSLLLLAAYSAAERILLVPLDNRPASGQYAEIIGKIGGAEVVTPPLRMLGNYTISGQPEAIMKWMEEQDLSTIDSLVLSADMLLYGSLFESRKFRMTTDAALARLKKLMAIRQKAPKAKLYLFSSIMRLTPSATHDQGAFRLALARYVELRSQNGDPETLKRLRAEIPAGALEEYDSARKRNHEVQKALLKQPGIDYLVFGQDDASEQGPQIAERAALLAQIASLNLGGKARICEGVDQISALLVSRALLAKSSTKPSVRILYSDPAAASKVAAFETQPLSRTVIDQIETSGARIASPGVAPSYTLYVNVPKRSHEPFVGWLKGLETSLDADEPVAVADTNISPSTAAPDPELYNSIAAKGRPMKLLAYAAWNTAANTIGTSVSNANAYLLNAGSRNKEAEVAQKQFTLYRMANDFAYHTMTRPVAYAMTEGPRQEAIFGKDFYEVNDFVQRDLSKFLKKTFFDNFMGRRFKVGNREFEFNGITDLAVGLPWPRPYEVRLDFDLVAIPVD